MKNKLLTVLNQCIYNKTIEDFNVIIELINHVNDDKTSEISLSQSSLGVYISMFNDNKLFSVLFTDNDKIMLSLPDDISRTYVIDNDGYNMQYYDIKALLNNDN